MATSFVPQQKKDDPPKDGGTENKKDDAAKKGGDEKKEGDDKKEGDKKEKEESPAQKMAKRWPQKVLVGALVGLPVNDDRDRTLGMVQRVVRAPDGGIKLIVDYNRAFGWFGWFTRPVAVPIEVVAAYGKQLASLDMQPDAYAKAPTWARAQEVDLPKEEVIRVALTRR